MVAPFPPACERTHSTASCGISGKAQPTNYHSWGTYNVHDPSCRKLGDYYYMYSTDAILGENRKEAEEKNVPLGFIQVRRSKDLVKWEFVGWAFPEIPQE